ncbi:copper/zinc superoxide dismutase domain-containing protein [Ceratobasidium sp. AG-Ba]|nr:copper/zinc superoxide dismutase domain-containing protein [Ceratobasidium sp. AG-Ba]
MLFTSAVLALSTLSSVLATSHFQTRHTTHGKRTTKYYARAEPKNDIFGVHAIFEFFGKPGEPTFVVAQAKGLTTDPSLGGPSFAYHIHTNPVPADGNCTKTLAHLDTLAVSEGWVCNPGFPQYCQNGDLSGKHGKLNGTTNGQIARFGYSDEFVRFYPESHSILGRSIVIHSANKTRIACANITSNLDGTADWSMEPTHKPSNYVKNYPTSAPVPPGPPVSAFNGTVMPDPAVFAAYPYPIPMAALTISEAPNVKLGNITHSVKYNNTEKTITQLQDVKSDEKPPFKGSWDATWFF